jgi:putative copper export protein
LSGGLWIGTLFILLVAGFTTILQSDMPPMRRGTIAANMVHRFSPFALTAFATLALSGLITAWRHLKRIDALWTTAYGWTLVAKLCVVLVVVGLGAWNWRRQRPLLGTESAAAVLQRSAIAEVVAATVVLLITSVLVSLPSPR